MRHPAARALLAHTAAPRTPRFVSRAASSSSSPSSNSSASAAPATAPLNPRWLSDLKARIGKCIMFGLKPAQVQRAGAILLEMSRDWRELVAGSEGFLTTKGWRGLYRQGVVWGEMVRSTLYGRWVGHVNNVTYNRYAESARVNWTLNYANIHDPAHKTEWSQLVSSMGHGLILRSIKTDYKFPMTYPDRVTVLHKLRSEPSPDTDSFILDVIILSEVHRRAAARCVEDVVVYDYKRARKAPLKGFMVEQFRKTFALQEAAKQKYGERVKRLAEEVRGLEQDSWDKEGAVEDFGSSKQQQVE
ncbi:uncharacterized protein K452DRAFT_266212 [Aplosporella prunicola CBS 121167]|uniref:Thioesterase/thiol ester dehydrase-isomerase n=1 Tax=Aplosporella prunicola CBS 121167 TaxID=1176127 RepID=A0A6A6BJT4_9PEZI|nr:uncharacterized protein K452DRAFT_266212 [Aplosporella prunicola CBS 121167]KAF2144410.1 hypothetical protein K452DRAFT_266212 [Aplosporella prunicola CBS 121167]